jgi:hypothetical protein
MTYPYRSQNLSLIGGDSFSYPIIQSLYLHDIPMIGGYITIIQGPHLVGGAECPKRNAVSGCRSQRVCRGARKRTSWSMPGAAGESGAMRSHVEPASSMPYQRFKWNSLRLLFTHPTVLRLCYIL